MIKYRRIIIDPDLLLSLYWGNGYSTEKIADIFGCGGEVIRKRMIKYDIPRRIAGTSEQVIIEHDLLMSLYWGNGYANLYISNIFDCGEETIRRRMMEYGIPRRSTCGELTDFTFNDRQKEILEGLMLGDGGLGWLTNYCYFANSDIHKDYLVWLQKRLGVADISSVVRFMHGDTRVWYQLRTRVIPSIRDEFRRWYPYDTIRGTIQNRNYKIFPKDIEMTLIKMLFWYIGDGSYSKKDKAAFFTNGLDFDEWSVLSKKICKLLDVNTGISISKLYKNKEGKQKYKARLNKAVTNKFFDMVDSLGFDIPECYQYKFGGCCNG